MTTIFFLEISNSLDLVAVVGTKIRPKNNHHLDPPDQYHMYSVSQDEEFRTMIRAGERMEFWYGHWFDCTVVNEDLDHAFEEVNAS